MEIFLLWLVFAFIVAAIGSKRKIGFGMSLLASLLLSPLLGLIIVLLSGSKPTQEEEHRFMKYHELAKREEFKGNIEKAIEHYGDTLYYLENDYKKSKFQNDPKRESLVTSITKKLGELKSKVEKGDG